MYKYEYLLFGGAAGPGKSYILRWGLVELLMYYAEVFGLEGVRVGLFCENYISLKDRHISKIKYEFPQWLGEVKDSKTEGFAFKLNDDYGGGIIAFRNLDDPAKYASSEFAAIAVDELTKNKKQTFEDLRFRKRWPGIEHSVFMAASNPGSIGHGWVKKLWIDKDFSGDDSNLDPTKFLFVPARARENPYLPASYWDTLNSLPEAMRRAMEEGDWDVFAGQVFMEFSRNTHVIEKPGIPFDQCRRIITFDWGYNAPGCALWLAVAPEDQFGTQRVYAYRELYQNQKTPEQWADEISIFTKLEKTEFMVLPHDCFARPQGGRSIASIFQSHLDTKILEGHTLVKDARKNRVAVLHQFLANARDGRPNLYILDKCRNLIRTLPELVYDPQNIEDVDTAGDDHCLSGDTPVLTNKGWIPIERLANAKVTGYDADVIELTTYQGDSIKCTPNHKILTPSGWQEAQNLSQDSEILWSSVTPSKSITEKDTTFVDTIFKEMGKDYIEKYGLTNTESRLKDFMSTTKMETAEITGNQTLGSSILTNTLVIIPLIQRTYKEKQGEETQSVLVEKVITECLKRNEVRRLKSVGYAGKKEKVYDIGVKHKFHGFIANGFIVHNCYDALSLGLVTIKERYKLLSGPIDPLKRTSGRGIITTKDGYRTPDFWEEIKSRQFKKPNNPEMR